jgi:ferric-dicitrate binding protein FerR (iron transport regulator)
MSLNKVRLRYLLRAYLDNRIGIEEMTELKSYMCEPGCDAELEALVTEVWEETGRQDRAVSIRSESMYDKIWNDPRVQPLQQPITRSLSKMRVPYWRLTAGLAAMLFLAFGLFLYFKSGGENPSPAFLAKHTVQEVIVPGGNKALLTLADGRVIRLDQAGDGLLANEAGTRIVKTEDGQIFYEPVNINGTKSGPSYNTISTPRGGEYRVILPDGTKVWLNAESSLHYPSRFSSDKRIVELVGEAYFEVNKQHIPFFVKSSVQTVEVLGTHFNVNAYKNNSSVKTTLLEGSVRVSGATIKGSGTKVLQPNQQSAVSAGVDAIRVSSVDASKAVAWKNGYFAFYDENIVQVMSTLARWYDIDVIYQGDMSNKMFGGTISRFENIETLLKTIELTGSVRFRIEGRKVIVMT